MNHLSTEFAARPNLKYPFNKGWAPTPGSPHKVADGIYWLRMPLPISLDHINLWLLRDNNGWIIVDSGYDDPLCTQVWEQVFEQFVSPEDVHRIIITHFHPDHIGLASWLARRCDCKVWISRGEFTHYDSIINSEPKKHAYETAQFVKEIGFVEDYNDTYLEMFSIDQKSIESRLQAEVCEFIKEGDKLDINGKQWEIVMGNGHSPEHACLYCPGLNLLISGDQALPRISSNISVYLKNRDENPLGNWLDSCAKLRDQLPTDTLVLPSHQELFFGLDLRMQQLIDDHHAQLNRLRIKLAEPTTTDQARRVLFDRELSDHEIVMASGEALAHINYLLHSGEISQKQNDNGVIEYQLI